MSTDLSYFDAMIPCGIDGVRMTTVERETGAAVSMSDAGQAVERAFAAVFGLHPTLAAREDLPLPDTVAG